MLFVPLSAVAAALVLTLISKLITDFFVVKAKQHLSPVGLNKRDTYKTLPLAMLLSAIYHVVKSLLHAVYLYRLPYVCIPLTGYFLFFTETNQIIGAVLLTDFLVGFAVLLTTKGRVNTIINNLKRSGEENERIIGQAARK